MVANMLEANRGQTTLITLGNFRPQTPCCTMFTIICLPSIPFPTPNGKILFRSAEQIGFLISLGLIHRLSSITAHNSHSVV